jgi:2-methylcitrate dehydratase PrpD
VLHVDRLTSLIAEFASTSTFGELREEMAYVATRYTVDSLACAIAAYECRAARIRRRLAQDALKALDHWWNTGCAEDISESPPCSRSSLQRKK